MPSEAPRSAAKGTQGVAPLHSTAEAGEPGPRGPWGGKGEVRHGLVSGTPVEGFVPQSRVHVTFTDSKAGSEAMTRRTGCLSWARPDLREGWEATPIPTRPSVPVPSVPAIRTTLSLSPSLTTSPRRPFPESKSWCWSRARMMQDGSCRRTSCWVKSRPSSPSI